MKKSGFFKRITAYVLSICLLMTGMFVTDYSVVQAKEPALKGNETVSGNVPVAGNDGAGETTTVYFYNEKNWAEVAAYVWGDSELLGGWPGSPAETATDEVGEGWWKATVPADATATNINIIFNNNNNGEQAVGSAITRSENNYVTTAAKVHPSKEDAEVALGLRAGTTLYFYNSENWSGVYAHAYANDTEIAGVTWPGREAEEATDIGAGWWKVTVPQEAATNNFNVIFNNNNGTQTGTIAITGNDNNFATTAGALYTTKEEAVASVTTTVYFYNADGWENVYAHAYANDKEIAGVGWPGRTAESAAEKGENWWKVTIPANNYNVIFNNNANQAQSAPVAGNNRAVTADGKVYPTCEDAEVALGLRNGTEVYFYNSANWEKVYAHAYVNGAAIGDVAWPGRETEVAADIGEGWWKVTIPQEAATTNFSIIFNNNSGSQTPDAVITSNENNYVTVDGTIYTSKEDAEAAINDANSTVVYFYNDQGWDAVYGYAHANGQDADAAWPGREAERPEQADGKWWKLTIPRSAADGAFNVIFNNGSGTQVSDAVINRNDNNYVVADATTATVYSSELEADIAAGRATGTNIYFLNSAKWENVGAYIYGDKGELLGKWPAATTVPADELGGDWVKVTVSDYPPYNIAFFNKDKDSERAELLIPAKENIYVTITNQAYKTQKEAEDAVNNTPTTIYFLNDNGEGQVFEEVYAYAYDANDQTVGDAWPGIKATEATNLGENWWQIDVPANALLTPFTIIFSDNGANQMAGISITNYTGNYITAVGDKVYETKNEAERSVGIINETVVYFLNDKEWPEVGAYVYGDCGTALGLWPGATAEAATELGGNWLKVTVPAKPSFNIIFHDKRDTTETIRSQAYITNEKVVYVVGCKADGTMAVYGSKEEAELAMGLGDPSKMTTLYFYNNRDWETVYGYVFRIEDGIDITVGNGWPGRQAEEDLETGEKWWKLLVPRVATEESPFYVVFNDGLNQTEDILIKDKINIYITPGGGTYPTAAEAEEAAAKETYDDGCEEGPNTDLDNYNVTYSGAGAALPYVTYEAENANTNAEVLAKNTAYRETIQSEASGRQAVELKENGQYVEFTLAAPANAMVLRYNMPDSASGAGNDASLSMYVNGAEVKDLPLTSKYAWVYGGYPYNNNPSNGMPHRYFDEMRTFFDGTLPAGTTVRLQKDAGDSAANYVIDFIECELVGEPITQPEGSLSVTDYGAVADDGQDDRAAFEECIAAAQEQDKEVWIPAGTFNLDEEKAFKVNGVTIRGAGMWHTNLVGAGVSFHYKGTCKFYDFAMTGVTTVRDDDGDLAGFEGVGRATNVTIQNIWMEHIKVGVWSSNTANLVIQGCRVRNTYADGINLCSGTNNATVQNNNIRNTGDDGIAIWPWLANCSGNTITHNTVQVPTLANGIAIYGGGDNVADSNYVADIINNGGGICVGSEFATKDGYTGTITVKNNVLDRCGSMQTDEGYPIGAIWLWSSFGPMTTTYDVHDNQMNDCSQEGILIECNNELTGVNIQRNTVNGATDGIYVYGSASGSGKVGNLTVNNLTEEVIDNDNPNFVLTEEDEVPDDDDEDKDDETDDDDEDKDDETDDDDEDKDDDNGGDDENKGDETDDDDEDKDDDNGGDDENKDDDNGGNGDNNDGGTGDNGNGGSDGGSDSGNGIGNNGGAGAGNTRKNANDTKTTVTKTEAKSKGNSNTTVRAKNADAVEETVKETDTGEESTTEEKESSEASSENTEVTEAECGTEPVAEGTTEVAEDTEEAVTEPEEEGSNAWVWILLVVAAGAVIFAGVRVYLQKKEDGDVQ